MNATRSRFGFLPVLIITSLSGVACAPPAVEEPLGATTSDVVATVMSNTAKVERDRLIFPKSSIPDALRTRIDNGEQVILVGDRQKGAVDDTGEVNEDVANPYGYIRRVLSVRDVGTKTIMMTEEATLEEALEELQVEKAIEIRGDDTPNAGLVKPQTNDVAGKLRFTVPVVNVANRDIVRTADATIRIKSGSVKVDTTVDLGVDIAAWSVQHAHANLLANLQTNLVLEAAIERGYDASVEKNVFTKHWAIGAIGPIPVTLELKALVGCDVHARGQLSVSGGLATSLVMNAGVSYDKGAGMDATFSKPSFTPRVIAPTVDANANASATCWVRPEVSLLLAGTAGPSVRSTLYGRLQASVPTPVEASLTGGVTVDVSGKLSALGHDIGRVDQRVFEYEKPVWSN